MSRYINVTSTSDTVLASSSNYSTNTSLNRRGSNNVTINKVCITNASNTVDVTAHLFLNAVNVTRTINQQNATTDTVSYTHLRAHEP